MTGVKPETQVTARTVLKLLQPRITRSRLALLAENLTRAFWPVLTLSLFVFAALQWNILPVLNAKILIGALGLVLLLWLYLLVSGLGRFHWPSRQDAIIRLEKSVNGQPIAALQDDQTLGKGDAQAEEVWAVHLRQMAIAAEKAKAAPPDLRLSDRDPWALRLIALLVFTSALAFGSSSAVENLRTAFLPDQAAQAALGPSYEGWAEPPAYTGKPTIYLNEITQALALPQGSRILIRVYGQTGSSSVVETVSGTDSNLSPGDGQLTEVAFNVVNSGRITVTPKGGDPRVWAIEIERDQPPTVTLSEEISRSASGAAQVTFHGKDDYGVVGGKVEITLDLPTVVRRYGLALPPENQPAILLDVPLPFNGKTQDFEETVVEDLARHPWANLPIILRLSLRDAMDNQGAIDPQYIALPGRRFFDPLAGAIAEQRRDLLWNRKNGRRISQVLRAITVKPQDIFENNKAYLITRTALRRLDYNLPNGLTDSIRDEIADLLWQAAILIEDGDLGDAAERLRRAKERLSEAIKDGASKDEISELMDELRRATEDYLRQLAENAERNGEQQAENQESQTITQEQLQAMMDRIQELMEEGRMAEAQELLDMLQQMMENMRVTQGEQGQEGQQGMEELQDTLRQQQGLADESFRQLQEQFNRNRQQSQQGGNQQQQPGPGEQEGQGEGRQDGQQGQGGTEGENGNLAQRQEALRQLLEQQRGALPGDNSEAGRAARRALEKAQEDMQAAEGNLNDGMTGEALENQADAIDGMREGLQQLGEAQRQAQNRAQGEQGATPGNAENRQALDPLGRPPGADGLIGSNENMFLDPDGNAKSRAILDEIRRRSGERERPEVELDYLKRLIERF